MSGGSLKLLGTTDISVVPSRVIIANLNFSTPTSTKWDTQKGPVCSPYTQKTAFAILFPAQTMVASVQGLETLCITTCCSSQAQHTAMRWHSCPTSVFQLWLLTTNTARAWYLLPSPCCKEPAARTSLAENCKFKLKISQNCLPGENRPRARPASLPPPLYNITNFQKHSPKIQVQMLAPVLILNIKACSPAIKYVAASKWKAQENTGENRTITLNLKAETRLSQFSCAIIYKMNDSLIASRQSSGICGLKVKWVLSVPL